MAIHRLLSGMLFDPEEVKAMTTAYEAVLSETGTTRSPRSSRARSSRCVGQAYARLTSLRNAHFEKLTVSRATLQIRWLTEFHPSYVQLLICRCRNGSAIVEMHSGDHPPFALMSQAQTRTLGARPNGRPVHFRTS
jgi:hypothetical protein